MTIKRWAARKDANHDLLRRCARELGLSWHDIGRPVDALVGAFGLTVACEVKTDDGKLNPEQCVFLNEFQGDARVLRSVEDVCALHRDLKRRALALRNSDVGG